MPQILSKNKADRNRASRIRALVESVDRLPSAPASAGRILAIATSANPNLADLIDAVESDPAVSLRVLRQANTASFNLSEKVEDIRQATFLLGSEVVRSTALCVFVREGLFKSFSDGDPLVRQFWRHSLACACAAKLLAERSHPGLAGKAFAAGLFHDCGRLALLAADPTAYSGLMGDEFLAGERLVQAEEDALGADHCLAGKWLLERWEIPKVLAEAAWLHHTPLMTLFGMESRAAGEAHEAALTSLIVALADRLAHEAMGVTPVGMREEESAAVAFSLGFEGQEELSRVRAGIGDLFAERAALFSLREDAAAFYFDALGRANRRLGDESLRLAGESKSQERAASTMRQVGLAGVEIARADTPGGVLFVLAGCMKDRFGASLGLAYCLDPETGQAQGHVWEGNGELRPVRFSVEIPPGGRGGGIGGDEGALPAALGSLVPGCFERASALAGGEGPPVHFRGGIAMVGVAAPGQAVGELMYRPSSGMVVPEERSAVSLLAQLSAQAFRRLDLARHCEERSERLAQMMRSLKDMNEKLLKTQRLAAVGQLAAGAAHEINNPLAIISARAQLLELREIDPAKKKGLRQMVEQIDRISAILGSLMDFARPAPPRMEFINPREVMDRVLGLIEGGMSAQGVTVRRVYQPSLPEMRADSRQIEQVLLNLALNAQHAMEGREGVLTVGVGYLSTGSEGDSVVFTVADTGVGIPEEHLEKIFDPFFTTKPEGKGTGLGLSTAYGIVQAHKGRISVESEPGRGAVFTVAVPRDPMNRVLDAQGPTRDRSARQAVLVVDDERHIRDILKESLESSGCAVEVAEDGEKALSLLRENIYQLMILDIRMPGRDGLALLREAHAFAGQEMPVLVLTGMASDQEIGEAKALGAAACMRKPFQVEALLSLVGRLLSPKTGA